MTRIQKSQSERVSVSVTQPNEHIQLNMNSLEQDSLKDGQKDRPVKGREDVGTNQRPDTLVHLSGTRKAVRVEVFVLKDIIDRRIQDIFPDPNKDRKTDHYLVVWEGYPLKKEYFWEPIENLYGHEDLAQTYDQWSCPSCNLAGSRGEVDRAD
jgi:hypothetical protein